MDFLYSLPAPLLLVSALISGIAISCAGQIFVHSYFRNQSFIDHNEVGGVIIAVSGTLYAVLIGFLTFATWEHYQEAHELVVLESDADIDAWHTAVGLPPSLRDRVRADMLEYAQVIATREMAGMKHDEINTKAGAITMDAMDAVGTLVPANTGESNAQIATMQQLTVIHDARQQRIGFNRRGISRFEWLVLAIGATCIVCFCWLFGVRNSGVHLLMTSAVATIIVSMLVLLFELQHPFRSSIGIGHEAWTRAIEHINSMEAGKMKSMKM
ncbi:MAG: hypothetical protein WAN65_28020 [Candidatus Sulfotelmatobacter sp.]